MAGRFTFSVLFASCILFPESGFAQSESFSPGGFQQVPFSPGGNGGPAAPRLISQQQAGFPAPDYTGPASYSAAQPNVAYYGPDGNVSQRVAMPHDVWEDGPIERFLSGVVRQSWIAVDYQIWDLDNPADTLLGSPIVGVEDPTQVFPVFDFQLPPSQIGNARVATMKGFDLSDNNGVRFTHGVPLTFGDLETSIFMVEQSSDRRFETEPNIANPAGIPPILNGFIATSTFVNGQLSNNVELYNSLEVRYTSEMWGANAQVVLDSKFPGEGLKLRPLFGFRYINVEEELFQVGVFNNGQPTVRTTIDSKTENHIFGPSMGLRGQLVHRWFTIDAEPKIVWGINRYQASVSSDNFRSNFDPNIVTSEQRTIFSPIFEFGISAKIHVNENITFRVGYDLLYLIRLTRPENNIFYNDNGPLPTAPGIIVNSQVEQMFNQVLSIGGEIRFK